MLARHAPTGITQKHYQDFSFFDLWAEIDKLPPLRWTEADAETVRAVGTDNSHPCAVVRPVVRNDGDSEWHNEETLENKPENRISDTEMALEPTGFEPATSWLQTRRSPN